MIPVLCLRTSLRAVDNSDLLHMLFRHAGPFQMSQTFASYLAMIPGLF